MARYGLAYSLRCGGQLLHIRDGVTTRLWHEGAVYHLTRHRDGERVLWTVYETLKPAEKAYRKLTTSR